jgi:hypothetical protein
MRLFIAREALDRHLAVAGDLFDPKVPPEEKIKTILPRFVGFYARWYPTRWIGWGHAPRFSEFGPLAGHVRYTERTTRRLARAIFHLMARFGPKLERRQALLFRTVDIGADLFAMTAALSRAQSLRARRDPSAEGAVELADLFCRMMRRRIARHFRSILHNDDVRKYRTARRVLAAEHLWLEAGLAPAPELARPAYAPQKEKRRKKAASA